MKKLLIIFLILNSRFANGQFTTQDPVIKVWDTAWATSTVSGYSYTHGNVEVKYDTIKCIMLCSDTTTITTFNLYQRIGGDNHPIPTWRHDVWWEFGYEITTNIWSTHIMYLDRKKQPYKGFVWLSYTAK